MTTELKDYEIRLERGGEISDEELAAIEDDLMRQFEEQRIIYQKAKATMDHISHLLRCISLRNPKVYRSSVKRR